LSATIESLQPAATTECLAAESLSTKSFAAKSATLAKAFLQSAEPFSESARSAGTANAASTESTSATQATSAEPSPTAAAESASTKTTSKTAAETPPAVEAATSKPAPAKSPAAMKSTASKTTTEPATIHSVSAHDGRHSNQGRNQQATFHDWLLGATPFKLLRMKLSQLNQFLVCTCSITISFESGSGWSPTVRSVDCHEKMPSSAR
jgi:hypothetical protein